MNKRFLIFVVALVTIFSSIGTVNAAEGWHPNSGATAQGSIANTRHNFTMSYLDTQARQIMDSYRNDYGEVCVYCHTPHGANSNDKAVAMPLWNRTINTDQYTVFDKPRMVNQPITQPGPGSLTCLSCHDGTISPDSIINMPGSGRYNKASETDFEGAIPFLDRWSAEYGGRGSVGLAGHKRLQKEVISTSCMACHNPSEVPAGTRPAPDFTVFAIEEDLRDDHPIGILFPYLFGEPLRGGVDFFVPTGSVPGTMDYFDTNGNTRADTNEVRLYDTGDGPEVECASCHDPHGVPSAGKGSRFNPSFLRVNNGLIGDGPGSAGIATSVTAQGANASALCLTCHDK